VIVVILNPSSGLMRHAGLHDEIAELCRQAGLDAHIREIGDGCELVVAAREALAANPEAVVAGGGDGTVSAVASVLAGTPTPLGVLPLGTLNHFAKDLGIPTDRAKAIAVIAARRTRRVDIGRVNDRIFVNNSSIGVYPSIVETRERLRKEGRTKWAAVALATFDVLRRDDDVSIRLEADRTKIIARTPFVFVGNNEYLAEGIRLGGRTRIDGGQLSVYFAPPVRTRHLPRLFAHSVFGFASRERVASLITSELWIDTPFASRVNVACDGELYSLVTPLHYRSWAGALNVLT
jgi:diacylglycerol kinase family enzyme